MGVLDSVASQLQGLPVLALLVGHCSFVALLYRGTRDKFLLNYWVGLLSAVGGGVVSAYLLQDPKVAPNPIFSTNAVLVTWTVCWYLINYFPMSLPAGLASLLPVRIVLRACTNVLRAGTLVARVDAASRVYPGVWGAAITLGTIGGSGGKFLSDAILSLTGLSSAPVELITPGFAWRSGFLATSAYYLLVHIASSVSPREGKALVTIVFIVHGLLSDLVGSPLDFTAPVARVVHAVTNIPQPGAKSAPQGAAAADSAGKKPEAKKEK